MKTNLLLLSAALLASSAFATGNYATPGQCGAGFDLWDLNCDGKIDGDEAEESQREYHEYNNARHQPAAREGFSDEHMEKWKAWGEQSKNPNQLGTWVKVSNSLTYWKNAGAYAVMLSPGAQGHSCAKGQKGLIAYQTTERVKECHTMGSEGGIPKCVYEVWVDKVTTSTEKGYKAECQ